MESVAETYQRASCRIERADGSMVGSGIAVSPNHVATAAHVWENDIKGKSGPFRAFFPYTNSAVALSAEPASAGGDYDAAVFRIAAGQTTLKTYVPPGRFADVAEGRIVLYWPRQLLVTSDPIFGFAFDPGSFVSGTGSIKEKVDGKFRFLVEQMPSVHGMSGSGLVLLDGPSLVTIGVLSGSYIYKRGDAANTGNLVGKPEELEDRYVADCSSIENAALGAGLSLVPSPLGAQSNKTTASIDATTVGLVLGIAVLWSLL